MATVRQIVRNTGRAAGDFVRDKNLRPRLVELRKNLFETLYPDPRKISASVNLNDHRQIDALIVDRVKQIVIKARQNGIAKYNMGLSRSEKARLIQKYNLTEIFGANDPRLVEQIKDAGVTVLKHIDRKGGILFALMDDNVLKSLEKVQPAPLL